MNRYRIRFLDDGYAKDEKDYTAIKGESKTDIVRYLWKKEKDHIYKIMIANDLTLWQSGEKTLLCVDDDWYDLDKKKTVSIKYLQQLKKDGERQEIKIGKLRAKQFQFLVMLMCEELCDKYGGVYLEFYQKIDNEWVDMLEKYNK
jgi:hypothetical protein